MSFRSGSVCLGAVVALTVATVVGTAGPAGATPVVRTPRAGSTVHAAPVVPARPGPTARRVSSGPAAVTGLAVSTLSSTKAVLGWTVTSAGRADSSLQIVRADGDTPITDPTQGTPVAELPVATTTWTDASLSPGATYTYGVFGVDQSGPVGAVRSLSLTTSTGDNSTGFAGIVRDRAGRPVPGVTVATQSEDGSDGPTVTTGRDGTYRITGLAPGNYGACFEPDGVPASVAPTGLLLDCYRFHGAIDGQWPATIGVTAGRITPSISANLSPGAAFSGTVTDTDGNPLAGVRVEGYFRNSKVPEPPTTVTGNDGTYTLRGIPATSATACFFGDSGARGGISDTGYVGQCYLNASGFDDLTPIALTRGQTTTGIDGHLSAGGAIQGRVVSLTGEAVPNVQVSASENVGLSGASAVSGANGSFRILGLPAGQYTVCFDGTMSPTAASPNAYLVTCFGATPGRTQPASAVTVTVGQRTTVTGRLRPAGGISGRLTGPDGSSAVGVAVQVVGIGNTQGYGNALTDSDGNYHIGSLGTGSYEVCFDASDSDSGARSGCYLDKPFAPYPPRGNTSVHVSVGATTTGIGEALLADAPISGTVRDTDGNPIPGLPVTALPLHDGSQSAYTQTDESGNYVIHGLAPGDYAVCFDTSGTSPAAPYGYVRECYNGQINDYDTVTAPATGIDADLPPAGAVSGTVTGADGSPVGYADVSVIDANGLELYGTNTDSAGHYEIDGLPSGTYQVCADGAGASHPPATGWASVCTDPTVAVTAPDLTSPVDLVLPAGAQLRGVVTSRQTGHRANNASVDVFSDGGQQMLLNQGVNLNGTYTVSGLAAGTYEVCFEDTVIESCYDATVGDPTQATPIPLVAGQAATGIDGQVA